MSRPPVDRPTGRKVTLYMLPDIETAAREIGGGNLSAGVAKAVRGHEEGDRARQREGWRALTAAVNAQPISNLAVKARKAKRAK